MYSYCIEDVLYYTVTVLLNINGQNYKWTEHGINLYNGINDTAQTRLGEVKMQASFVQYYNPTFLQPKVAATHMVISKTSLCLVRSSYNAVI